MYVNYHHHPDSIIEDNNYWDSVWTPGSVNKYGFGKATFTISDTVFSLVK